MVVGASYIGAERVRTYSGPSPDVADGGKQVRAYISISSATSRLGAEWVIHPNDA